MSDPLLFQSTKPAYSLSCLLTTAEAARILTATITCLATWRMRGIGPRYVQINGRVAYRSEDIAQFIMDNYVKTTGKAPIPSKRKTNPGYPAHKRQQKKAIVE